jgi:hypothetical protein
MELSLSLFTLTSLLSKMFHFSIKMTINLKIQEKLLTDDPPVPGIHHFSAQDVRLAALRKWNLTSGLGVNHDGLTWSAAQTILVFCLSFQDFSDWNKQGPHEQDGARNLFTKYGKDIRELAQTLCRRVVGGVGGTRRLGEIETEVRKKLEDLEKERQDEREERKEMKFR